MDTNDPPIVVEQTFNAPIATVWKSITDLDQMRQWYFETIEEFKPQVGFESRFTVSCEDREFIHVWTITDVVPEQRIAYGWRYEGITGNSTLVWELSDTPEGTKLTLTHTVLESFPQDDPMFSRESGQAGWDFFIHERLKAFLEPQSSQT
ncbi:MAG: SRPBCC domain-containing protein [Planctomycetota bacterium]|nr:SRPBCC domain-containing protein [Planctomycetota bacterium]